MLTLYYFPGTVALASHIALEEAGLAYVALHVAHAHKRRGARWADDPAAIAEMRRKVPETMTACFDLIEQTLLEGPWVLGENYSIADPYLFTIAEWIEGDSVDVSRLPKVVD